MSDAFLAPIAARRSYYGLAKESPIPDAKIEEIVAAVIKHTPSSFNSQSTRIIIAYGAEHTRFWDTVTAALKAIVPEAAWGATEGRMKGFQAGYATILFFDDETTIKGMQTAFAAYADNFPGWAAESNAMHQFAIWTALELEGLGANLQHYHGVIMDKFGDFGAEKTWIPKAQMVIGKPVSGPGAPGMEKTFKPIEGERLLIKRA